MKPYFGNMELYGYGNIGVWDDGYMRVLIYGTRNKRPLKFRTMRLYSRKHSPSGNLGEETSLEILNSENLKEHGTLGMQNSRDTRPREYRTLETYGPGNGSPWEKCSENTEP